MGQGRRPRQAKRETPRWATGWGEGARGSDGSWVWLVTGRGMRSFITSRGMVGRGLGRYELGVHVGSRARFRRKYPGGSWRRGLDLRKGVWTGDAPLEDTDS